MANNQSNNSRPRPVSNGVNKFFEQLKKEVDLVKLSRDEREKIRHTLFAAVRSSPFSKRSPVVSSYFFLGPRLVSSLAFVLMLAVVGTTSAYAAEGALPGDLLYQVKVRVNEPIIEALARSPEAKAEVNTRFAVRRMQEAETLAALGTMTSEAKVALEEQLEKHASAVEAIVATVEEADPVTAADISSRLQSSIEAHSAVIARLGERGEDGSRRESEDLSRSLRERSQRPARAERPESGNVETPRASRLSEAALQEGPMALSAHPASDTERAVVERFERTASSTLEEAEGYLAALVGGIDATTSARTRAQISKIREHIKKLRTQGNKESDKQIVERALKDAVTVKTFIEAQKKFQDHTLLPAAGLDEDGGQEEAKNKDEGKKGKEKDNHSKQEDASAQSGSED